MKVLGGVLTTIFVLMVSVPLAIAVWIHFAWAAPDVGKQVRSAEFQQRHAALVAGTDQALGTFVSTAPRGTALATSVLDRCDAYADGFGAKPTTKCRRDVVVYVALDGDSATLQRSWAKSLAAAGWKKHDPDSLAFSSDRDSVHVAWHTGPALPTPVVGFETGVPYQQYGHEVILEQHAVDVAGVYEQAYARGPYLVELRMTEMYYPDQPRPSPSPTTTRVQHPCFSGSGTCVGG